LPHGRAEISASDHIMGNSCNWKSLFSKKETPLPPDDTEQIVEKYIKLLLSKPSTEIRAVPDVMERKAYSILFHLLFHHLQNSLHDSKIIIFDHEITFRVQPVRQHQQDDVENENASLPVPCEREVPLVP